MKKLQKIALKDAKVMTADQMKHITGGSGALVCCRYQNGEEGCEKSFYAPSCDGHENECGGRFYTCVPK